MKNGLLAGLGALLCVFMLSAQAADIVPPEVQMPGTQPGEVSDLRSTRCDNCHGDYDPSAEPSHNLRGSMMAHSGRDPIFWATMAVAEQDFDGAGDLCIRCHMHGGWQDGRSTPTDGSALTDADAEAGIECELCHRLTNPDQSEHIGIQNAPFIAHDGGNPAEGYYGSGQTVIWDENSYLGPYDDAEARHGSLKSNYHHSSDMCGTCHDVSNPVVGDLAHNNGAQVPLAPGTFGGPNQEDKAAFNNPPYKYGVVERTYSEHVASALASTPVSAYSTLPADLQAGSIEKAYLAATAGGGNGDYEDGTQRLFSCQTCHMSPAAGAQGCNKNPRPRPDMPVHDLTGGNYWMPAAIQWMDNQGTLRLGGGLSADEIAGMNDGMARARANLEASASLSLNGNTLKVINLTGHKLISGYPEGRRMWLNMKWYDSAGALLREDGAYGPLTVDIDGVPTPVDTLLDLHDPNTVVYEAHGAITQEWANQLLGLGYDPTIPVSFDRVSGAVAVTLGDVGNDAPGTAHESFHFVLNNQVVKDNRIPPYGMAYDESVVRNILPVPANQYGNPGAGGAYNYWDEVSLNPPAGASYATIELLYQPTSWEYIQFLDRANNGSIAFLADEGRNMLDAWLATGMAAPHVMASVSWGAPPSGVTVPDVVGLPQADAEAAITGAGLTVGTVTTASNETVPAGNVISQDPVAGNSVPTGSAVNLVVSSGPGGVTVPDVVGLPQADAEAAITGAGLTVGTVTTASNETVPAGNVISQDPAGGTSVASGTAVDLVVSSGPATGGDTPAGVNALQTGYLQVTGKGKNQTIEFIATTTITVGETVAIRATVLDDQNQPVADATVTLDIAGPENLTIISGPSDGNGVAEATWETSAPNKKGNGGTATGAYTATTSNVTATGYSWDGVATATGFTLAP